jgi:hypothetical protein
MENALKAKLEKEGLQKVQVAKKNDVAIHNESGNVFLNIIKEGNDEFQSKTGRTLTYSEMRDLYG